MTKQTNLDTTRTMNAPYPTLAEVLPSYREARSIGWQTHELSRGYGLTGAMVRALEAYLDR